MGRVWWGGGVGRWYHIWRERVRVDERMGGLPLVFFLLSIIRCMCGCLGPAGVARLGEYKV